jgi:hypothetical protein
MLRSTRFEFTPDRSEFLCALIPKLDIRDEDERACLAFALELLEDVEASGGVYPAFVARKQVLVKALQRGRRLGEQLAASNFETLLSQGQRLTWVDEALARRQMSFVDRACRAVFGRIPPGDSVGTPQVIDFEGPPNPEDLLRHLL